VQVDSLIPGDSLTLTFDNWTALHRGATTAACSTALAADESTANDRVSRNFNVRVRDVSADSILAPNGNINLGVAMIPQARVTNHGTGAASFIARLRMGVLAESAFVMNMAAGTSRTVSFPSWTPDSLGTIAVLCTLALTGDSVPANNSVLDSCTVVALEKDAGVLRVVAPRGVADSGAVLAPQAMVRNFGTDTISFAAIFTIGTYVDTQQVTNLPSLDSVLVTFADWTASPVGWLTTRCATALDDDSNPANNTRSDSVHIIIRTIDAGAVRIIAPPDTVDSGSTYAAQAVVRNFGIAMMPVFQVKLRVGGSWADTVQVDSLAAGESLQITFADYTVPRRGLTTCACSTWVTGDQDASNDRVQKYVFRRVRDVSALGITTPTGLVPVPFDTVVIPTARLWNFGNTIDSFPVVFRIGTFYEDTARTNDTVVTFRPCTLNVSGTFVTQCSTAMTGDLYPTNDVVFDSVQVAQPGIAGDRTSALPRIVTLSGSGPVAGRAEIRYGLPRNTVVRLEVYDACGRLVSVLASGVSEAGYHTAVWKCTDERGRAVAEGAYFVRLVADDVTLTSKVVKTE